LSRKTASFTSVSANSPNSPAPTPTPEEGVEEGEEEDGAAREAAA
jgi:hypothetical protein